MQLNFTQFRLQFKNQFLLLFKVNQNTFNFITFLVPSFKYILFSLSLLERLPKCHVLKILHQKICLSIQKQSSRGVLQKSVLRNSQNSQENTCARVSFLIKLQTLRPATLLNKRLWHRCFPANFVKFLRKTFLTEHLRWLLLSIIFQQIFLYYFIPLGAISFPYYTALSVLVFKFTNFVRWLIQFISFFVERSSISLKVGLSPSKKNCFIYLNESSLKLIKMLFYFILKAHFVFKIFKFQP